VKGKMMKSSAFNIVWAALVSVTIAAFAGAQPRASQAPPANGTNPSSAGMATPPNYLIGPQDVLSIVFWREKDMSADVVVRPDGKISLPLLNEIDAAGHSPEKLRDTIAKAASKFMEEPNVTVVVKEIHSRNVYVMGQVTKAGTYPLATDMTVLQAIALAGGLLEYADESSIVIMRKEDGRDRYFKFNFKDVVKGKNPGQNIVLKPGDTVIVP
jgi:polysaccharide biosynthesis/export protein